MTYNELCCYASMAIPTLNFGSNLFAGGLPDADGDPIVALQAYGASRASEPNFGSKALKHEWPRIQVLTRGPKDDVIAAHRVAHLLYRAFGEVQAMSLSGTFYKGITCLQPPFELRWDGGRKPVVAFNIEADKDVSMSDTLDLQYFHFGGDSKAYLRPASADAYPAGATFDKLVSGSIPWSKDSAELPSGTYLLEAIAKVEGAGARAKVCLVNLDDGAPDAPLAGSEISFTADNTTGERKRSSAITFPTGGAAKNLGVKVTSNSTTIGAAAWGCRLVRTA